ncbi:MAG: transporter [Coprococcus phoceensis]
MMIKKALGYENASSPSKRLRALLKLQEEGFDVTLRLSPLIEEYLDFDYLNRLPVNKVLVEFLRVNGWMKKWFPDLDYQNYVLRQSGYWHLPLEEKIRILEKIHLPLTVCEDVTEHYEYWKQHINPNPVDCCNLRK